MFAKEAANFKCASLKGFMGETIRCHEVKKNLSSSLQRELVL